MIASSVARTIPALVHQKTPLVMVTAYDYTSAQIADEAGVDIILVGDSLAHTMQGKALTLPVTLDEIVYHTSCVTRGVLSAVVISDLPFMSYGISREETLRNGARCIKEGGAHGVKLEGGRKVASLIKSLSEQEIPVLGHIGLTPQSIHRMGGYKVQGKQVGDEGKKWGSSTPQELLDDAYAVQEAGAFAVVVEGVPVSLGKDITDRLSIPTIGIGAGPHCRGQVLVFHDLMGLSEHPPRFAKAYLQGRELMKDALVTYSSEVRSGAFPTLDKSYKG
jgi:3-methyl-2-oxobutanoate hydroxymethyltransferase